MDFIISPETVNKVPEGAYLARAGETVTAVFLVLKGKLALENDTCCVELSAGSFAGLSDTFTGQHSFSIFAKEASSVYAFSVRDTGAARKIISNQKDYAGMAVHSMAQAITSFDRLNSELVNRANGLAEYIRKKHAEYIQKTTVAGFRPVEIRLVKQLNDFEKASVATSELLEYYSELAKQPVERAKLYFSDSPNMALHHLREASFVLEDISEACSEATTFLEEAFYLLINNGNDNLYIRSTELLGRLKSLNKDRRGAEELLESIKDTILQLAIFFEQTLHRSLPLDIDRMEEAYIDALSGSTGIEETEELDLENIDAEAVSILRKSLSGGATKLVEYAGWNDDRANLFVEDVEKFVNTKVRLSNDEGLRALRKEITNLYMDLYQDVFLKSLEDAEVPIIVDLFLNYSFVDDRLLKDEQLMDLCALKPEKQTAPCQVYSFREWLKLIYDMRRIPSKSEMDLDFEEYLRDKRKRGEINDLQLTNIAKDPVQWISYEVHNMFTTNIRMVSGQITTFVPILHEDSFSGIPSKSRMTKDRVNALVSQVLSNDPTLFYREMVYNNKEAKVEREFIMKCVYPEFVVMPINGANIVMWQDTSARKRDSAGRFMLPAFFEGMPEDAMIRALGRFRWELCKTIQSISWNNIQVKSLTSEYYDYIEYYRKNRDLSEEKKEKVKSQMSRARNNLREAFVQDYECWVKYESAGAIRMNKVAREILATYIPFPKSVRESISAQPIFADATARFERNLKKKLYDLELRYKNLEKNNVTITPEMISTKEYYRTI